MPNFDRTRRFSFSETDPWLQRGLKFVELSELYAALTELKFWEPKVY